MTQSISQGQTIPAELDREQTKGKNNKFIIGGLLIIGLIIYLIFTATMQTGAYYLTVTELNQQGASMVGERVRVSGDVVVGSEDWNPQEITLRLRDPTKPGPNCPSSSTVPARTTSLPAPRRPSSKASCSKMAASRRRLCCLSAPAATKKIRKRSLSRRHSLGLSRFSELKKTALTPQRWGVGSL